MIARTLVPKDAAPLSSAGGAARRASTFLDDRQVIPAELPVVIIDRRSNIPTHVPLDVLATKLVVPRDLPPTALQTALPGRLPQTALDDRVVVPRSARPAELEIRRVSAHAHGGVLDPDLLTTGQVNLLARPVEEETTGWSASGNWQSVVSSILFHAMIFLLVLLQPKMFPPRPPTTQEIADAHRMLGMVYVPEDLPRVLAPPPVPQQRIKIDPRIFQQIAPPEMTYQAPAQPAPGPLTAQPNAPAAGGQRADSTAPPVAEAPRTSPERVQQPRFETPKAPDPQRSPFALPNVSAGKALEESLRGAARNPGGDAGSFGGPLQPRGSGGGGGSDAGGTGSSVAYGQMELLTPTEGVDFTNYLNRVLASVRRNWYAVIPASAWLGDKGVVVLEFRIMRNGAVPPGEPGLVRPSGRDPLDLAAISAIKSSNPFEPLPAAFSGPFIALRFTFLYNVSPEAAR
jgi:hypothetical protein